MDTHAPDEVATKTSATHVIKCKCMTGCGLHFIAYSWHEDWAPNFCPECGGHGTFIVWRDTIEQPIFTLVPGLTQLTELTQGGAS